MRKQGISVLAIFLFFSASLWADPIDRPVAIIKLYESESVTQGQFKNTVKAMEKQLNRPITMDEKKQLLDQLINEKLLIQAANKEKITVTDSEITQLKEQTRKLYEQQLGRPLSDDEFKTMVEQTGYSWDNFLKELKKGILAQKYIKAKKGSSLENIAVPTDKEILDRFYTYQHRFVFPEMVRLKQIYINPNLLSTPAEKESAKKKAQAISREIKAGASFDNYWEVYDDSGRIKIGSLIPGLLRRDDDKTKEMFGTDFFNTVFSLKAGETSDLIASKAGYHIVVVLEKIPFKVLGIDDLIPPQNSMTVRSYLKTMISKEYEQAAVSKALDELVAELRKTAEIKRFDEYMTW